MAFTSDSARILDRIRDSLRLIEDNHTRSMAAAWVRAWDDVSPELAAALEEIGSGDRFPTRAQLVRSRRLINALAVIEDRLADVVDQSAQSAIQQLAALVQQAGTASDLLVSSMLPPGESVDTWSRVDPRQVDAIVQRTTERITKRSYPLSNEATASIKRNLVRGMLTGSNPREVARRAVRQAEQGFNGGLTRAMTIARTEMLDAHRAASALAQRQQTDVLAGWVWTATLGSRTCPACWGMHGTEHPLDEPGPEGHQNCRCVRVPKTKTWRELGIDIDEPASVLPNRDASFKALSASEQLQILGPIKYQAWRSGRFPIDEWAQKQTNSGWRDSYVPAKAPTAPTGANPILPNAGGGSSGQPPQSGQKAPGAPDPFPPIGKVLQAQGGNDYVKPGQAGSKPVRPFGDNPDHEFEYIPDPADRMTGMLQYYFETQELVKAVVRNIRAGLKPMKGVARLDSWSDLRDVLKPDYKLTDLRKDVLSAGTRLAAEPEVDLGTVYRGLAVTTQKDTLLNRYKAGWTEDWSLASATNDGTYAETHASFQSGRTKVVWIVTGAKGQILRTVGRMAGMDERLVNGRVVVESSLERADGVVEVHARWQDA